MQIEILWSQGTLGAATTRAHIVTNIGGHITTPLRNDTHVCERNHIGRARVIKALGKTAHWQINSFACQPPHFFGNITVSIARDYVNLLLLLFDGVIATAPIVIKIDIPKKTLYVLCHTVQIQCVYQTPLLIL